MPSTMLPDSTPETALTTIPPSAKSSMNSRFCVVSALFEVASTTRSPPTVSFSDATRAVVLADPYSTPSAAANFLPSRSFAPAAVSRDSDPTAEVMLVRTRSIVAAEARKSPATLAAVPSAFFLRSMSTWFSSSRTLIPIDIARPDNPSLFTFKPLAASTTEDANMSPVTDNRPFISIRCEPSITPTAAPNHRLIGSAF